MQCSFVSEGIFLWSNNNLFGSWYLAFGVQVVFWLCVLFFLKVLGDKDLVGLTSPIVGGGVNIVLLKSKTTNDLLWHKLMNWLEIIFAHVGE